jgi:hypothetical protein
MKEWGERDREWVTVLIRKESQCHTELDALIIVIAIRATGKCRYPHRRQAVRTPIQSGWCLLGRHPTTPTIKTHSHASLNHSNWCTLYSQLYISKPRVISTGLTVLYGRSQNQSCQSLILSYFVTCRFRDGRRTPTNPEGCGEACARATGTFPIAAPSRVAGELLSIIQSISFFTKND